ncbi:MAG: alpha/beta hydrolase [Actinomycetota bacterium]|nr:alpha/beta hydrolase [Actinomycetota bacterium]
MRLQMSDGAAVVAEDFNLSPAAIVQELPIVLLHGLSQQRHYWRPVIDRMRGGRIITLDQRGHGDASVADDGSDIGVDLDFRMDRLAADVIEVLDALNIPQAIVVGHSWGASVALHTATAYPARIRACALIDGGLFGPRHLVGRAGSHDEVREALRPPPLGMMQPVLWEAISAGDLSPYWGPELQAALEPTFRTDEMGRVFSRLGMDRHMAVLDGLFDYDSRLDIPAVACPVWVVVCDPRVVSVDKDSDSEDPVSRAWEVARDEAIADLPAPFFVQRWHRALHDVPLQWPALVAGLLETIAERTRA